VIAASVALAALLAAADAPPIAFVHVEANVGGSSGGHTALRIGELVYHFQQTSARRLVLERDDWAAFRHSYAGLQNRTLHLAWLDLADGDAERIARRFSTVFVSQEIELSRAQRLRDDAAWLAACRDGGALPPLRGAGLSSPAEVDAEAGAPLRAAIAAALGEGVLDRECARAEAAIAAFRLERDATDLESLREALSLRESLRALIEDRAPPDDELIDDAEVGALGGALGDPERAAIERLRDAQGAAIVALLRSGRPDRGFALAVAIARHRALARALRLGRWVLLDPFSDDAVRDRAESDADASTQARLSARAAEVAREARDALLQREGLDEGLLNALEDVFARCREAQRGARGEAVRIHLGRMVPSRGRSVGDPTLLASCLDGVDVAAAASSAKARSDRAEDAAAERYSYSLLERNCVTELLRVVNSAFPDDAAIVAALGARLEPGESLGFVPWVFHDQVRAHFHVAREEVVLSHRLVELARLESTDPGLLAVLREQTTLSSTIYRPRTEDGEFLFFTDDTLWQRPLRGVANVGYGLGQGLAGVLTAPFDGGRRFRAGFHGAFFSVPELFFGNVRKGSFDFVEEDGEKR
jgi:hypothetical protein